MRFSDLLEDLCRDQLGLEHIAKYRGRDGAHFTGVRLRTTADRDIGGFIDIAVVARLVVKDCDDYVTT